MALYNFFLKPRAKRFQKILNLLNSNLLVYVKQSLTLPGVPKKGLLLEIGVGQGDMQEKLCTLDQFKYIGFDYNYTICNTHNKTRRNINASIPYFPIKDKTIAVVYCSHVIEHLQDYRTVLAFLNEVSRTMSDNGIFFLLFPDYDSWKEDFFEIDYSHSFPMGSRRMMQLANDSGFDVVRWIDYNGPYLGVKGRVISFIAKLLPLKFLYKINPVRFYSFRKTMCGFNRNLLFVLKKKTASDQAS